MATYVKGNAVANATKYDLREKQSDGTYTTLVEDASEINFNVTELITAEGDHTLVVVAQADGYTDSDPSNEVVFTVAASTDEGDTGEDTGDSGNTDTGTDITSQFTFTANPVGYEWGWVSGESSSIGSYPGTNAQLTHSNFVNVEDYSTLEIVNVTRNGTLAGTTGGWAFYTDDDVSETVAAHAIINGTSYTAVTVQPASFIEDGCENRHHANYGAEGVIKETIEVPDGAKYIRITGWVSGSAYQTIPFSCVGYK